MKKLLALVLALVMTLGLATVGASAADYSDAADISKDEAVAVMSALKVFDGMGDGSFNPKGSLTREQGAKIIASMIIGRTAADALAKQTTKFSDVAADRWSAGSIAYCTSEGIIAGIGNGKFDPTGELTGYAFAKMCLVALGYNPEIEGFVGNDWQINVAKAALTAGLAGGLSDVDMTKPLTREQACQMALNTEQGTMVEYKGGVSVSGDGNLNVTVAADRQNVARTTGINYNQVSGGAVAEGTLATQTGNGTLQFCERYASKLLKVAGTDDDFGRPNDYKWTLSAKDVVSVMDDVVCTFTASTKAADVAKALSGYYLRNAADTASYSVNDVTSTATTYTTGTIVTTTNNGNAWTPTASALTITQNNTSPAAQIAALTGNGVKVEVYANSNKVITDIVVVGYKVVEAGAVTTTSVGVGYSIDGTTYTDYTDENVSDTIVLAGAVAKGDYVTYTKANGVCYVYPTTKVEGTQSGYTTASNGDVSKVTVDGTTYTVGSGIANNYNGLTIAATYQGNNACILYLDQFGFVAVKTGTAASTNYAYIVDAYLKYTTTLDGTTPSAQVRAVLADGTVGVYDLALGKYSASVRPAGNPVNSQNALLGGGAIAFANGDYFIKGTDIIVYDADGAKPTDGQAEAAIGLIKTAADGTNYKSNVWGYTLSDNTITLEELAKPTANLTTGTVYRLTTNNNADDSGHLANGKTSYKADSANAYDKTIVASTNTTFVLYNSDTEKATVYTGAANLPKSLDATKDIQGFAVVKGTGNKSASGTVVFATVTNANQIVNDAISEFVYLNAATYGTTTYNSKSGVKTFTAYKADGSDSFTVYDPNSKVTTGAANTGLYAINDSDEVIDTLATTANTTINKSYYIYDNAVTYADGMVGIGTDAAASDTYYAVTSDTQIRYLNDTTAIDGNTVYAVLEASNGSLTGNVKALYVVGTTSSFASGTVLASTLNNALKNTTNVTVANGVTITWDATLNIPAGTTLTIDDNLATATTGNLTVNGTLNVGTPAGTAYNFAVDGAQTVSGTGTIAATGNLAISAGTVSVSKINVNGTIAISGGTVSSAIEGTAAGSTVTISGGTVTGTITTASATGTGDISISTGGTFTGNLIATADGANVTINKSGYNIGGNITASGTGATLTLSDTATIAENKTVTINGVATLNAAITVTGKLVANSLSGYTSTQIGESDGIVEITTATGITATLADVNWQFDKSGQTALNLSGMTDNRAVYFADAETAQSASTTALAFPAAGVRVGFAKTPTDVVGTDSAGAFTNTSGATAHIAAADISLTNLYEWTTGTITGPVDGWLKINTPTIATVFGS